jgi:hypothetical protein
MPGKAWVESLLAVDGELFRHQHYLKVFAGQSKRCIAIHVIFVNSK